MFLIPHSASPNPHYRIERAGRAYLGLLLFTICLYALMYSPQALLNTISKELGSSMGATGLLIGVFMFSLAISPIFVGILLDRTGVRRALLFSAGVLGCSGLLLYNVSSFGSLLAVRCFQALFVPVGMTAIMASISAIFRHMDLPRALAGYIACNIVGSVSGRVLGGWCTEFFGWRLTLASVCLIFFVAMAILAFSLQDPPHHKGRLHRPKEYLALLDIAGVPSILYVEACGIFVFAGLGNLIPFRMDELGAGASEGRIGLMYLGYMVGLVASLALRPLLTRFGSATRLLVSASLLYAVSFTAFNIPSQGVLFAGIWVLALGQFIIHALCPSLVNRRTAGLYDRGMVNALYLSCYYMGGVLGSIVPMLIYSAFGWFCAYLVMQLVLVSAFLVLLRLHRGHPEFARLS